MKIAQGLGAGIALMVLVSSVLAVDIVPLVESVVESNALNFATGALTKFGTTINGRTHQQLPMATFNGWQYATFYDQNRHVCLARRKLPGSGWETIRFTDYSIEVHDTHNAVVVGICEKDGTIHLVFDHHGSDLHYRASVQGLASNPETFAWDASLFGSVTDTLGSAGKIDRVTYPRFFSAPNGNLMLYYRYVTSANGDGMIQEYDGAAHDWTPGLGRFVARDEGIYTEGGETSAYRCPYLNCIAYAGDRLHCSWVWRDKFNGTSITNNHDLCYTYSDDNGRTWRNSDGTLIGETGSSSVISIDSPGLHIGSIPRNSGLKNQNTHFAYADGRVHAMLPHYADGTTTMYYHHYWRTVDGVWSSEVLSFSGGRPKLLGDDDGNLFLFNTGGGMLSIHKGVPNASMSAWSWSLIHEIIDPSTGGEACVDFTRWDRDRILSVYGQENPSVVLDYGDGVPFDGLPSALYIHDLHVTSRAILPEPTDGADDVAFDHSLEWTAGIGAVAHRVYWGTNEAAMAYHGEQAGTSFSPTGGSEPATYYWRIDEVAGDGGVATGAVWNYTTAIDLPPVIEPIPNQSLFAGEGAISIPLTVHDDFTPPDDLLLSATSSNQGLLRDSDISISGSGTSRTLMLVPVAGASGSVGVLVSASDGALTAYESFTLTVHNLVVQDVDLGTWSTAETWDPDGVPVVGNQYETTMRLRTPTTTAEFLGDSLTILPGGQLQLRNTGDPVVTVPDLILEGGTVYAGTGGEVVSTLDGAITVRSASYLRGYWNNTTGDARSLRIRSKISGGSDLISLASVEASTHTLYIENPANDFGGVWISESGTIEFAGAEAVGKGSIVVGDHGKLAIHGNWDQSFSSATLTVSNSPSARVEIGTNHWKVAVLSIGDTALGEGEYTADQLNALGDAVFSGSGNISVGLSIAGAIVQDTDLLPWDDPAVWDPDGVPVSGEIYTANMRLRTPSTTATFPGDALYILPSGDVTSQFQLRNIGNEIITVPDLILAGGTIYAGTGNNETNTLDGCITVVANSFVSGYWGESGPRSIRLLALVEGDATLTGSASSSASTHEWIIDNPGNTFSGTWISRRGKLHFTSAGAVGAADILVETYGGLRIDGDWNQSWLGASLTVANSSITSIELGNHHWVVAGMQLGSMDLSKGVYTVEELNAMSSTLFEGSGTITVGTRLPELSLDAFDENLELIWEGDGLKVQMLTNGLASGDWFDLPGVTASPMAIPTTNSNAFFRLVEP
ncbi:hypothetical protein PDESU_05270 [Pontiella desulfatans]|uniref:Uncharacterized protein n=2 Tax=Pontiella desulfatans TaxID=2750659 RepID=A0A6C2U9W6_PONDE|nr:hypothetical protein PDESU_05270 [Pontiella desulfatans]